MHPYYCVSRRCVRVAIGVSKSIHHQRRLVANCSVEWGYPNNQSQLMAQQQKWVLMEKPPGQFLSYWLGLLTERGCDMALRRACSSVTDIALHLKLVLRRNWFYATSSSGDLPEGARWEVPQRMLFIVDLLFVTPFCLLSNCMAVVLVRRVLEVRWAYPALSLAETKSSHEVSSTLLTVVLYFFRRVTRTIMPWHTTPSSH